MGRVQEALLAMPDWPSDIGSALNRTPKEILSLIKSLEDFLIDKPFSISFSCPDYSHLTALIGCFASLEDVARTRILNAVVSSFSKLASNLDCEKVPESISDYSESFEVLAVLLNAVVTHTIRLSSTSGGGKKVQTFDWAHLKQSLLSACKTFFSAPLTSSALYRTRIQLEQITGYVYRTFFITHESHLLKINCPCKLFTIKDSILV